MGPCIGMPKLGGATKHTGSHRLRCKLPHRVRGCGRNLSGVTVPTLLLSSDASLKIRGPDAQSANAHKLGQELFHWTTARPSLSSNILPFAGQLEGAVAKGVVAEGP